MSIIKHKDRQDIGINISVIISFSNVFGGILLRAKSDVFNCPGLNTHAFTPSLYEVKRVQVVVCDGNRYRRFHSAVSEEDKDQNLGGPGLSGLTGLASLLLQHHLLLAEGESVDGGE